MNINELRNETQKLAEAMSPLAGTKEKPVSVEDAIRISKILCTANEERLPMILNVFEKAGVYIGGLEELEDWKAFKAERRIVIRKEAVPNG